jgi:hypothetical protein
MFVGRLAQPPYKPERKGKLVLPGPLSMPLPHTTPVIHFDLLLGQGQIRTDCFEDRNLARPESWPEHMTEERQMWPGRGKFPVYYVSERARAFVETVPFKLRQSSCN